MAKNSNFFVRAFGTVNGCRIGSVTERKQQSQGLFDCTPPKFHSGTACAMGTPEFSRRRSSLWHMWPIRGRSIRFLLRNNNWYNITDCPNNPRLCFTAKMFGTEDGASGPGNPLFGDRLPLDVWYPGDWDKLSVCTACLPKLKETHAANFAKLWCNFSDVFRLPD
ncbi:hypothetical protein C8J57DRAFT_1220013 [Mycena rebaudengoi]|nr:hypothetical protein C8J57DRAFT_1220013 [Mycena rebaudengoi]